MKDNVTLIPARRRLGNNVSKQESKPKLESQRTVELVLTAMNRLEVMKFR